ncbi:hypothetical protein VE03_00430 [Pseudogymnoascus sp. 23342-1-I1]|nr:hypothetical protein VE03_00430 [Pseudogymnoascus sp. 23342-1-I1]
MTSKSLIGDRRETTSPFPENHIINPPESQRIASPCQEYTPTFSGDSLLLKGMEGYSKNKNEVANVEWPEDVLVTEMQSLGSEKPTPKSEDTGNTVELCYGMICEGKAAFVDGFDLDWDVFRNLLTSSPSGETLTLSKKNGIYSVMHDKTTADIAILDTRMSDRLRDISKIGDVRIRVFLDESTEITDLTRSASGQPPALQVLLVLYGKRSTANAIGKILSQARIYLQHPVLIDSGITYENPHHFKTPKNRAATAFDGAHISPPTIQTYLPAQPYIEEVLQTLEQNTSLHEREPDVRIKANLLPHQKEALCFILERENRVLTESLSLWSLQGMPTRPFYQHSITEIKMECHPGDPRGGILADEMGLGKTLSIISAIVSTLEEAQLHQSGDQEQSRAFLQSKATLVLAPSATHFVRNQTTKQFKAVLSLTAQRRWVLSGTPVQNSAEDIGALIRILRVPELESRSTFQKYIISPLATGMPRSSRNLRLLLNSVCLRRLVTIMNLPAVTYQVQRLDLSPGEKQLYEDILESSSQEIEEAISSKKSSAAYSSILRAILRTRMLCNHGTFRRPPGTSRLGTPLIENKDILASIQDGDEEIDLAIVDSPCNSGSRMSPYASNTNAQTPGDFLSCSTASVMTGHSTKLCALMNNLKEGKDKGKSIIFSSWKTTLDLAESLLQLSRIKYVRIDGNIIGAERSKIVSRFDTDPSIAVIIMTTGTGAVGLNLAVATQVHIIEPQWNPSIESQAIGRVLRLTQKQPVTVTRYITNNTVEQAVQERQSKKLELAELTFNQDMGSDDQMSQRLYALRSLLRK